MSMGQGPHSCPLILADNYMCTYLYLFFQIFTLLVIGIFCGYPLGMCAITIPM